MSDRTDASRRSALRAFGAAGLTAVAGCVDALSGNGGSTEDETDLPEPAEVIHFSGDTIDDFAAALRETADTPEAQLDIEAGTYEFSLPSGGSDPYAYVDLADFEGLRIDGNGAQIRFQEPAAAMARFSLGGLLSIRNLEFDYATPPFAQGTITEVSESAGTLVLELDPLGLALDAEEFDDAVIVWASVHEADSGFVSGTRARPGLWKRFAAMDHLGGPEWRLTLDHGSSTHGLEAGRRLAVLARSHKHALTCLSIDDARLDSVTIRAAQGMGTVIGNCGEATVRSCTYAPPPESDRLLGGNADGIHVYGCRSGPTIEDCRIERFEDDGIVVASTMATVSSIEDERTVAVDADHKFVAEPGDVLAPMITAGERGDELPPVASVRGTDASRWFSATPEAITFESAIDLDVGVHLANTDAASAGYEIRNNEVRNTLARNLRLAAPDGDVVDNVFDGSSNPSVLVESYTNQQFAPQMWVEDLRIANNEIRRSGLNGFANRRPVGIEIDHNSPAGVVNAGKPHRSITIENNDLAGSAAEGMRIADVDGLEIRSNELSDLNRLPYDRFRGAAGYALQFRNVANATVEGNEARGEGDRLSAFAWERLSESTDLADNELVVDGEEREGSLRRG